MLATPDRPEFEVAIYQPIDIQVETPSLEEQIRILEQENTRLREDLQFYVEMCCLEE